VTPKNTTGTAANVAHGTPTVKRVLQLSGTGQPVSIGSNVLQQQGAKPGAIKVIQIGANKVPTTGAVNSVTLSGGDGKTYKIVTIKSASGLAGQDPTGQKVTLSPANTPGSSLPRNVVKMLPGKSGAPLRATIVTAGTVVTAGNTGLVSLASSKLQATRVLSSQTTLSPSVSHVRTTASGQPIIIRTPALADGNSPPVKAITKVLKIIKPSISANIPATEGQGTTQIVHVSTPVIHRSSNSSSHPPVSVVPSQTMASVGTPLSHTVASSQVSNIVTLSMSSATTASLAVSSGISPIFRIAGASQQTKVSTSLVTASSTSPITGKISTDSMQIVTSTASVPAPVSLDEIVASKTEDEKMALDALNFLGDCKPDIAHDIVVKTESDKSEPVSIPDKTEPMEVDTQDSKDIKPLVKTEIKSEIKDEVAAENKSSTDSVIMVKETKEEMKTEVKEEVKEVSIAETF
jgi:hypothetical protein